VSNITFFDAFFTEILLSHPNSGYYKYMLGILLVGSFSFFLGIFSYRFYMSRLIRLNPEMAPLNLTLHFGEVYDNTSKLSSPDPVDMMLILTVENLGKEPVNFESWSIRTLNPQGFLRQLFSFPQNFVQTVRPKEKINIEIRDLEFLSKGKIYTLILRDIYGREWAVKQEEMEKLRKDLFWTSL